MSTIERLPEADGRSGRAGIERQTCERYWVVENEYDRLLPEAARI